MLSRRQRFEGSCLKSLVVEFGRCSRCFSEARLYSAPLAVAKSSDKIVFNLRFLVVYRKSEKNGLGGRKACLSGTKVARRPPAVEPRALRFCSSKAWR